MNTVKHWAAALRAGLVSIGNARLISHLRRTMSDRRMRSLGVSPETVRRGLGDWTRSDDRFDQATLQPSKGEIRRAISQLKSLSDAQLTDIGLARGDIVYAVRHGRFGDAFSRDAA